MALVDIFKFLVGFIVVSMVLYLMYVAFFRYRCKYNLARIYLLSIPIVALLSVSFTFNVIPLSESRASIISTAQTELISDLIDDLVTDSRSDLPPVEQELIYSEPSDHIVAENGSVEFPVNAIEAQEILVSSQVPNPSNKANQSSSINVFNIVLILGGLYLLGLITRLIILSIQVRKILSIKRWATTEIFNDITLYRSGLIETPFSFIRNIFIDRRVEGAKLQMIVRHELSHIDNKHYLDKNIVELMCIFMWFNPIVWCVRNELGAIHEFQADNNVIKDGVDVKTYQHYLFEEIMGKSPSIANGFNHSLIKKRMIMMMRSRMFKNSVAKTSLAIVSLILVFVSVSFKPVELEREIDSPLKYHPLVVVDYHNEVAYHEDIIIEDVVIEDIIIEDVVIEDIIIEDVVVADDIVEGKDSLIASAEVIFGDTWDDMKITKVLHPVAPVAPISLAANNYAISIHTMEPSEYVLRKDQVKGIPDYITLSRKSNKIKTGVIGIEVNEKETLVDYVIRVTHDPGLLVFSDRAFLRDNSANDMYKIREVKGGIPLGKLLILHGYWNQYVCFTLVFPPLAKGVEKVDFLELESDTGVRPIGSGRAIYDLDVQELKVIKSKSVRIIE